MKVVFCTPPPAQRVGGLDAALIGLRQALATQGVEVRDQWPGDVVHFHGLWQPAHARLSRECAERGVPCIISPHGMLEPWAWRHKRWKKWPYFHLVEKRHLQRASAILATAPAEARRLQTLFPQQRIETLPLGLTSAARPDYLNARRTLGWPPNERVLLFLSRLHEKKGLDLLFHALAAGPLPSGLRLVVVGDGAPQYVRHVQRLAHELATRLPPIDWPGAVWGDARWAYFQGADLFCLPTHSENFGLAVLEACQVGTPVLTTVETPWADSLGTDRGFIAHPTVASIRAKLEDWFARPPWNSEHRQRLSEWAWATYDWHLLATRYTTLYTRLAK